MTTCLLCRSKPKSLLQTSCQTSLGHELFHLDWCEHCAFGRLRGNFSPERIAGFYPQGYYTHSNVDAQRARPLREKILVKAAYQFDGGRYFSASELPGGKTACDIGCGRGRVMRRLNEAGFSTTGVEPDPIARAVAADAGPIFDGTAEQLPSGLGNYDVVTMTHVLEHCIDPVLAVSNARSILAPSGSLIIEVPNNAAMGFSWFGAAWPWADLPRHISFFTERSLRSLLEQCGLSVTKTIYTGFARQFSAEWREKLPGMLSGWPLLAASAFAPDALKYDSIRMHARAA